MRITTRSDIKFMKGYAKAIAHLESRNEIKEFDISNKQAPLKTFNEVNKSKGTSYKYSFNQHKKKILDFCCKHDAQAILLKVDEVNSYEYARTGT